MRVNITFYDAVNMIHDVITTANLFPYTVKFMFDSARKNSPNLVRYFRYTATQHTYSLSTLSQPTLRKLGTYKMYTNAFSSYHSS